MTEAEPLEQIPITAIRAVWPLLRDRILALSEGWAWTVEDVFLAVISGDAFLWTTQWGEGFVILQVHAAPYESDLHVWIACNDTIARAGEYMPQLIEIARENGCQRVTFDSHRRGWERELPGAEVTFQYAVKVEG